MTATKNAAARQPQEPHRFQKRIGSTVYTVSVYSSRTSKDTAMDKIARLTKREVGGKAAS